MGGLGHSAYILLFEVDGVETAVLLVSEAGGKIRFLSVVALISGTWPNSAQAASLTRALTLHECLDTKTATSKKEST